MDLPVTYEGIVNYMNSLEFSGMKLGIERIREALQLFGNPEKRLKIIHITGTNGKGSVAAMTSKILEEAGYKVGMFTSPHLVDVRERIKIDGQDITKEDFREAFLEAKSKLLELTFFELMTLMAVLHFVKKKVDYAIFEVGLGGRYDATNFGASLVSVITKISLDHTDILGKTIAEIASDKSGIITQGQTVVTTEENKEALEAIKEEARGKKAKLIIAKRSDYPLSLKGHFQKENAGIAAEVARSLGIGEEMIRKGLLHAKWPGRFEYLEKNILLDCAHNPDAIIALRKDVETLKYDKLVIVFAVSRNKDYNQMLRLLPKHHKLIFTQTSVTRRLQIDDIPEGVECVKIREPVKALEYAKSIAGEKDLILVCGSIFLVGDLKKALSPSKAI
jgi:dihydrofolate synthase/folylpolyglutamate synthase